MDTQTLQLTCPTCLAVETKSYPKVVDGAKDSSLETDIYSGDFFNHTCSQCGAIHQVTIPFLYIHSKRNYGIYLHPHLNESMETRQKIFLQVNDQFQSNYPNYQLRLTASVQSLIEKLTIWKDDKNDGAIEIVKILAQGATDLSSKKATAYYYHYRLSPHLMYIKENQQYSSPYPLALETFVLKKYLSHLSLKKGTFLIIDSLWAWSHLNKEGDLNEHYKQ